MKRLILILSVTTALMACGKKTAPKSGGDGTAPNAGSAESGSGSGTESGSADQPSDGHDHKH